MKIGESRSADRIGSVKRTGYDSSASKAAPDETRSIADTISIMGIPDAEMTPKVRSAIMSLMQEVDSMRRDLEAARRRITDLEQLADQDSLTPIPNRRAFVREMTRMISFSERYNIPTSMVFIDVNELKQINDTYNHSAGDAAILHVANLLQQNIRDSDLIGRLGGDEFGVILPNADEDAAHKKAASLAEIIKNTPLIWEDRSLNVSVAYGTCSFRSGVDAKRTLDEADRKMYAHKQESKVAVQ